MVVSIMRGTRCSRGGAYVAEGGPCIAQRTICSREVTICSRRGLHVAGRQGPCAHTYTPALSHSLSQYL